MAIPIGVAITSYILPQPQTRSSHSSAAVADYDPRCCSSVAPLRTMTMLTERAPNGTCKPVGTSGPSVDYQL
ncbi:hypothetical protein ACN42_g8856 [Penicillium freii]|uniref:Uncharacterized protein n=1 Tax=Penicillium freii TaxID=48697 RepID=A0A117NLW1_PENFR|nr:hypothetical protein ACN42_g8856 [Penicillium freii]